MKGMDGKWNFVLKANDGTEAKGVSIMKIECGGLWLVSDFKCEMGGQPFQGKGLDGYDPVKKKYVTVWVDSYTTAPMLFEGKFDESGKVLTMTCEAPMGEESTPSTWRSVSKFVSNDEHIFEMFVKPKGGEEKSLMVVTYKRAK